jgi:DNA invertase Pin-like site-specific DNA recombinase
MADNTAATPKACAIYARTALNEPGAIEHQIALCAERAGALSMEVHHLYADRGVSGLEIGPNMKVLLEHARHGGIEWLMVKDLDRLSRNPALLAFILAELSSLGIQVELVRAQPADPIPARPRQ